MDREDFKNILKAIVEEYKSKKLTDYPKVEINGEKFSICPYPLHVWYNNGGSSLFAVKYKENISEDEALSLAAQYIEDYFNGCIHCTECRAKFPKEEVEQYKRSYFAGKYCQHCWDTKWKEKEARETYD